MRFWLGMGVALMAANAAWAQFTVNGALENGTAGEGPGFADEVRLIKLEGAMQVVATTQDVRGAFALTDENGQFEAGRYLVQAVVGRAIYSEPVRELGQKATIVTYESAEEITLRASIGSMAIYAHERSLDLGLFYNLDNLNSPPRALDREGATFTFPVLPGYTRMEANTRRNNMPLRQALTIGESTASISYPLKPGRTQLMVRSVHPYDAASGAQVTLPLLEAQQFMNMLVLPLSLQVEGEGVSFVSEDAREGVRLYEWTRQEGQTELALRISGQPDDGSRQALSRESAHPGGTPKIENRPNPLTQRVWWILGGACAVLAGLSVISMRRARA